MNLFYILKMSDLYNFKKGNHSICAQAGDGWVCILMEYSIIFHIIKKLTAIVW